MAAATTLQACGAESSAAPRGRRRAPVRRTSGASALECVRPPRLGGACATNTSTAAQPRRRRPSSPSRRGATRRRVRTAAAACAEPVPSSPRRSGPGYGCRLAPAVGAFGPCPTARAKSRRLASVSSARSHSKGVTPVWLAACAPVVQADRQPRGQARRAGAHGRRQGPAAAPPSRHSANVWSFFRTPRSGDAGNQPTTSHPGLGRREGPLGRASDRRTRQTSPRSASRSSGAGRAAASPGPLQPDDVRAPPSLRRRQPQRR